MAATTATVFGSSRGRVWHAPALQTEAAEPPPLLSIVSPALDEEESVKSTVTRCFDARERIRCVGDVRDIEIIVVSDGSTDRTAAIAQEIGDRCGERAVRVIVFEQNPGLCGAAERTRRHRSRVA